MDGLSRASVVTMSLRIWKVINKGLWFSITDYTPVLLQYKYILFLNKPKIEPPSYKIDLHLFKSFYVQKAPYKAVDDLDLSILVMPQLHLPRALYDLFYYDFRYDFPGM